MQSGQTLTGKIKRFIKAADNLIDQTERLRQLPGKAGAAKLKALAKHEALEAEYQEAKIALEDAM